MIRDHFILVDPNGPKTSEGAWTAVIPGSGTVSSVEGEAGRPGILRLRTSNSNGSLIRLFKAPSGWESGTQPNPIRFDDIVSFKWEARLSTNDAVAMALALNNQISFTAAGVASNVGFLYDSSVSLSLKCLSTLNGAQDATPVTMPSAGSFHSYEVLIDVAFGQIDFKIDGSIVATHANTAKMPIGQALTPYALIVARENANKSLDLDDFELL